MGLGLGVGLGSGDGEGEGDGLGRTDGEAFGELRADDWAGVTAQPVSTTSAAATSVVARPGMARALSHAGSLRATR